MKQECDRRREKTRINISDSWRNLRLVANITAKHVKYIYIYIYSIYSDIVVLAVNHVQSLVCRLIVLADARSSLRSASNRTLTVVDLTSVCNDCIVSLEKIEILNKHYV